MDDSEDLFEELRTKQNNTDVANQTTVRTPQRNYLMEEMKS